MTAALKFPLQAEICQVFYTTRLYLKSQEKRKRISNLDLMVLTSLDAYKCPEEISLIQNTEPCAPAPISFKILYFSLSSYSL